MESLTCCVTYLERAIWYLNGGANGTPEPLPSCSKCKSPEAPPSCSLGNNKSIRYIRLMIANTIMAKTTIFSSLAYLSLIGTCSLTTVPPTSFPTKPDGMICKLMQVKQDYAGKSDGNRGNDSRKIIGL